MIWIPWYQIYCYPATRILILNIIPAVQCVYEHWTVIFSPSNTITNEEFALHDQQLVSPTPRRNKSCGLQTCRMAPCSHTGHSCPDWGHLYCATYSTRLLFACVRMAQSLPVLHSGFKSPLKIIRATFHSLHRHSPQSEVLGLLYRPA